MSDRPDSPQSAVCRRGTEASHVGADSSFSDQLERWLRDPGPKSVGALSEVFAEKGFAVGIMLLMFVPALPLPTGGVTHLFEAIAALLALEMIIGRDTVWLPRRWRDRQLGEVLTGKAIPFVIRRVRWLERFARPRLAGLFARRTVRAGLGVLLLGSIVGAALAPPFSGLDTLPALGAVMIALSIVFEDAVLLVAGCVVSATGIALIVTIGAAAARLLRRVV
jgi:hypothetical protein